MHDGRLLHNEVLWLVTGLNILVTCIDRWIQPLHAKEHPMYEYAGPDDSTRAGPED